MGFVFGLIGALLGVFLISTGHAFFGFLIGMMIGWLLSRLLDAQTIIRRLGDRIPEVHPFFESSD